MVFCHEEKEKEEEEEELSATLSPSLRGARGVRRGDLNLKSEMEKGGGGSGVDLLT